MKQCANAGHFYDADVHSECPNCKNVQIGATVALDMSRGAPSQMSRGDAGRDDGKTVAVIKEKLGIDPVVGWLVCTEGGEKGRDYRIHSDNNFIGRDARMDIRITGDDTISRENHAVISYDPRDKVFYFSPGDGRSIVRLNDKAIFSTAEIKPYDRIEIGRTKLVFLPLCGEMFEWA
jgi:hypothetical protein